jgi:hypothetical protein
LSGRKENGGNLPAWMDWILGAVEVEVVDTYILTTEIETKLIY